MALLKPIIAIDIDNTIAATDDLIRQIIKHNYGLDVEQSQITDWHYYNCIPISSNDEKLILKEYHTKYISAVKLLPIAQESLCKLSTAYAIWIITSRPKYTRSSTLLWLKNHSIPYDRIIFTKNKGKYVKDVNILIDDNQNTINEYATAGVLVIVFDYPWNRELESKPNILRAKDWDDVANLITENLPATN